MRTSWFVFGCLVSQWVGAATGMGVDDARHLLSRTGFGAPPAQVAEFSGLSRQQAVDALLARPRQAAAHAPPEMPYERPNRLKNLSEEEKTRVQQELFRRGVEMRTWWVTEMLIAPTAGDALVERMTLFWHNHFVSSQQKVKAGALMLNQNVLLRRYALGNFGSLLHAVAKDPAMVIYLDAATNRKGSPNENFAREVMELFTLGEGHYTEQDIKEAARAFTGWSLEPETGQFRWRTMMHDEGVKTVLGRSGPFDGDAVLDILLEQPATAEFIVGKLWREFVSPEPQAAELRRLAAEFRHSGYDIRQLMRALLMSKAFWSPQVRGTLTKAPVDFVIGTMRTLAVQVPDAMPLALSLRQLGQDLFAPPNVKGWPGGDAWLNSSTLLARKQLIERLLNAGQLSNDTRTRMRDLAGKGVARAGEEGKARLMQAMLEIRFDSPRWLATYPDANTMQTVLLAVPPVQAAGGTEPAAQLRAWLLDAAFQVK